MQVAGLHILRSSGGLGDHEVHVAAQSSGDGVGGRVIGDVAHLLLSQTDLSQQLLIGGDVIALGTADHHEGAVLGSLDSGSKVVPALA